MEKSLTGRRWVSPDPEHLRRASALARETGVSEQLAAILVRAGVDAKCIKEYLAPSLRELLPDPSHLRDLDLATEIISKHAAARSRIAIFADYDVDGAASAALLANWLRSQGLAPTIYVPDRIDEGYGPNVAAMEALSETHPLIVCVDCGTLSFEPISAALEMGSEVVVLDHHMAQEELPNAQAVVNPNRQDETSEFDYLCAAGVVFLLLVSLNRDLRKKELPAPDLLALLDLVALATVADVAPLKGLNRALVRQGVAVMARRQRPGLTALADTAGIRSVPEAYHLGYVLGPRINAGGRVGEADLGARLLITNDEDEAVALAERLDRLNTQRREIEAAVLNAAIAQVEERDVTAPLIWAAGDGWHPGVVGIVASRLKERYNRPAVVIGMNEAKGQGSARSVSGVDLGNAIARVAREGLFLKGGGHRMAAGLTVDRDQLTPAMDRLSELLRSQTLNLETREDMHLDGMLHISAATPELIEELDSAGPYGAGAPPPRYAFQSVRVRYCKPVGTDHLKLTLEQDGSTLGAILFNASENGLGKTLTHKDGPLLHVAGRLEIDTWQGRRKAKLRIEDAALAAN